MPRLQMDIVASSERLLALGIDIGTEMILVRGLVG